VERNFLIVAADGKVREALARDLRDKGFSVTLAENGSEAERVVRNLSVDCVLVETHLPDMSAVELRSRLERLRPDCRVVVLTSFKLVRNSPELLRFGAEDYLMRGAQLFELLRAPYGGESTAWPWEEGSRATQSLLQVVDVLVGLLEIESRRFAGSSHQVMQLVRATAEEMGASEDMVQEVVLGTLLRDMGKAALELDELPEVGSSPDDEQQRVKEHVSATLRLFEHIDFSWKILPVIRHHHERYNGSGAPDGLRGREIPMGARIVAVVDLYVAMTSGGRMRPLEPAQALQELVRRAGHQFDPEVVEAFHRVMDKRLAGRRAKGKPVVLLMEPDRDFRRLLKMRLLNEGLEVEEAESYEKTLERMLKETPDLALIDIDFEPTEAFQLIQEMQADDKLVHLPVAFLSQRGDRILKIRALRQGVDDFLSKAENLEELVARIENILTREAIRADGEVRRSRRGITGSLENLSLPDIIQTLTIGMKTACVSLTSGENQGKIFFENGTPTHAEANAVEGHEAFYEMVRWTTGEFVIEHGHKSKKNSIDHDAMYLLMEGLRLMDEETEEPASQAS
jgi:response regulator RpfG family c-di-GMP phosphodiesterase